MKQHQFRITLEHIADKNGDAVSRPALQFDAPNHDDIFEIIEKMKASGRMDEATAIRFAVGLKLMTEPMMEQKDNPFFVQLQPHIREMMNVVKGK